MAKYHLGAVKPHVQAAAEEIGDRFNYVSIGGWRAVGSVPNSDHPKGLAIDLMTLSKTKGDATCQYLIDNYARLGVKYIIYWRKIWRPGEGWSNYSGPNPHIDHVHVSFEESGGDGSAPDGSSPLSPSNWPVVGQIEGFANTLQSSEFWTRIGFYALGLFLVLAGFLILFRKPATQIATAAITKKVPL